MVEMRYPSYPSKSTLSLLNTLLLQTVDLYKGFFKMCGFYCLDDLAFWLFRSLLYITFQQVFLQNYPTTIHLVFINRTIVTKILELRSFWWLRFSWSTVSFKNSNQIKDQIFPRTSTWRSCNFCLWPRSSSGSTHSEGLKYDSNLQLLFFKESKYFASLKCC